MKRKDSVDPLVMKIFIERAKSGDEEAFTWLYKIYSKKVYIFAKQFFNSESIAEDIVQEVFIQVYKKIHVLKSVNAFSSWLHMITYHVCMNYRRGKIILTQFKNVGGEEVLIDDRSKNVNDYLESQRIRSIVVKTLDNMKTSLRVVGQLKFLEDKKNMEIAEILDIPNYTVVRRLKVIKGILRESLEKNDIKHSV
jgi:RNA polymerase sigma-70 factor (ECF subfamily)